MYAHGKIKKSNLFYPNGKLNSVTDYLNGTIHSSSSYYPNSKIKSQETYAGEEVLSEKSYDELGNLTYWKRTQFIYYK